MRSSLVVLGSLLAFAAAADSPSAVGLSVWTRTDSARLLDRPSVFVRLPAPVRRDLLQRGCRIPRASGPDVSAAKQAHPNNVVTGAFFRRAHRDWAVLCSIADTSRILVYADGRVARIDSLAKQPDGIFLEQGPGRERGFARQIGTAAPGHIRRLAVAAGDSIPRAPDHFGVDDYFAGKASVIYYFHLNHWQEFQGWD